jgi:FAD/FMN-containing dehydrogenase
MTQAQAAALEKLNGHFRGELLYPGNDRYESARRIWNGMVDRRPGVIARCLGTSDVIHAVNTARDNDLLLSVKGGGHSPAGSAVCDDGLMIDLSLMRRVNVDAATKSVRVDGGALIGDLDHETQLYGMAVSGGGVISHTGVGGLALGGGFGWISRKHGLAVDNLLSADVVTADGKLRTASADENPDLYWGIRGGGGNFGVVPSFRFRCAEIPSEPYSGVIVKRFEDTKKYIQFHREYVRTLPDDMTVWMIIRPAPPLPFLPEAVHGKRVLVVPFVWLGDDKEGAKLIQPLREATASHGEMIGRHPWVVWQSLFDGLAGHGARNYWKSHHLKGLADGCIDRFIEYADKAPTEECEVFIPHMEGAPSRVPETATAYAHRKPPFTLNIHTRWRSAEDDEKCLAWARDFHRATEPFAEGVYVNFLSQEGEDVVKTAYTPEVWDRLARVKRAYDPENLFRMNQNVKPAGRA